MSRPTVAPLREEFDICGPLPRGLTLLEASAGTGKTFAIVALAVRYVASGVPLDDLLIITFTRAATGELRDRVRQRLGGALHALERRWEGSLIDSDPVHALLASGSDHDVDLRRRRLAGALADFDRATIVTTHAFCEDVLRGLGTAGGVDRDISFLEDPGDLLAEVVDDLYVRKFLRQPGTPEFSRSDAGRIAQAVAGKLGVDIEPHHAPTNSPADLRQRFALAARREIIRRKRQANTLGYDDILLSLADTLDPPGSERAVAAAHRLRERYQVVLVDEFQDTDPTQWKILQRGFAAPLPAAAGDHDGGMGATLVLVGDPKQAIYSFRGADVWTYLEAASQATEHRTLSVNWRSDQGLLDGIDALLDGAALGHREIRCHPARAADTPGQARLVVGGWPSTPVRIRVLRRNDARLQLDHRRIPTVGSIRQVIAEDLARDVVGLLASGAQLVGRAVSGHLGEGHRGEGHGEGEEDGRRPLVPGDVAVLVGTNRQAGLVRSTLDAAGVPAVINGGGNVFATTVAVQWLQLLEALERPSFTNRARAAALTVFLGWDASRLAASSEADVDVLQSMLHSWAAVLDRQGVAALVELITVTTALPRRVLARPDGERVLTDLRHIGELLHAEAVVGHLGVAALTAWVRRRISEGERTDASEERSRRLESDAEAVQVLTVHRSKGLEFPVVYLPDLADHVNQFRGLPAYHDPDTGMRTLDVGGDGSPDHPEHRRRFEHEELGEDLRQAYVALTRARQQLVLWWGPFRDPGSSPLGCLLLGERDADGMMTPSRNVPDDDGIVARLEEVVGRAPHSVVVEAATHPPAAQLGSGESRGQAAEELDVRRFDRSVDTEWRRTSYTAIIGPAHGAPPDEPTVGSEPEQSAAADELAVESASPRGEADDPSRSGSSAAEEATDEARLRALPSPMADLPKGAAFGIEVHSILERVDFDAADLIGELTTAAMATARFGPGATDPVLLAHALARVIETPLGPLTGELRLRDVAGDDRLDEVGFELPLAGGDRPHALVTVGAVADLLRRSLPVGDPLADYPDRLADPAFEAVLRGYLTGSIDLLLRIRDRDGGSPGGDRFVVVDYKTNWLGPAGDPLTAWPYRPSVLAGAMSEAHYPLQALLYSVAVHRYLRWRLVDYDPARHLGGVLYLFVRGMAGAGTPRVGGQPCGVFAWRPPAALVVALSDLFDRGGDL